MKIINIDADENLALKAIDYFSFIEDLLSPQRNRLEEINRIYLLPYDHYAEHDSKNSLLPKVRYFEQFDPANVANLIHTIPIFLRNDEKQNNDGDFPRTGPLGAYITNPSESNEPRIELYLPKLEKECTIDNKFDEKKFKYLFVLILMHELGHAALDINNCSWYATPFDDKTYKVDVSYNDDEVSYNKIKKAKDYEEAMADAIAYRIIKQSNFGEFKEFAKSIIREQQGDVYKNFDLFEEALDNKLKDFMSWKIGYLKEQLQNNDNK